jgi:tetratricopeptide (TPR) repeat protein
MTHSRAAPEIFQLPLSELPPDMVPTDGTPGTPEFEEAVILNYAIKYAVKGWQAAVTVDDGYVRVVAIPEQGMDPKEYVLGLLRNGFLEDALPILEALDGMFADPEIAYNFGICLSELGRVEECIEPLERCIGLHPGHANAWVGLGVAYARLERADEALAALSQAAELAPGNPYARRNLGAVLMKAGRFDEALPHLFKGVALAPDDPAALFGLAECLETLGGEHRRDADGVYADLIQRFPQHHFAELAREARTRIGQASMREATGGALRMDAVFYMQDALERFAEMSRAEIGQITMEIALLGRQGLEVNNPDVHYTLKTLDGEFTGLHLLCLMHVGIRRLDPEADTGTGLDKEYDMALAMAGKK